MRNSAGTAGRLAVVACLAMTSVAGKAPAERITMGTIMAGTRYATTYYVKRGEKPGPSVVVIGGVHGDEMAGYMAARRIARWKVSRGTLTVLPDAHKEAIRRKVRGYPGNMNRMFPGNPSGNAMQRLAFQILQMTRRAKPDLVLTLHESLGFHSLDPHRYGQTLTYDFPIFTPYFEGVLQNVNVSIRSPREQFRVFVDPIVPCATYQMAQRIGMPATSIETCRVLPLAKRIRYQMLVVAAFLDSAGLQYDQADVPHGNLATLPLLSKAPRLRPMFEPAIAAPPAPRARERPLAPPKEPPGAPVVVPTRARPAVPNAAPARPAPTAAVVRDLAIIVGLAGVGAALGYLGWRVLSKV